MIPVDPYWFDLVLYLWLGLAGVVFILLVVLKIEVPYGRYVRTGWGSFIRNRAGWVLMEFPSLVVFAALFLGKVRQTRPGKETPSTPIRPGF